ncbi:MAG: hypothetical protein PHO00_00995 [bacterium]|nr:hypothetical protein [bacterium]
MVDKKNNKGGVFNETKKSLEEAAAIVKKLDLEDFIGHISKEDKTPDKTLRLARAAYGFRREALQLEKEEDEAKKVK